MDKLPAPTYYAIVMASERIQRRIETLLDEADEAVANSDWSVVRDRAQNVLRPDPENQDALSYLAAAERDTEGSQPPARTTAAPLPNSPPVIAEHPTSFANGRYQVKEFLGEGGRKRALLAHDTLLDREVAIALIKTEGLDEAGRSRIQREAQAMGRLGSHQHIVTVFDLGQEARKPYIVTERDRHRQIGSNRWRTLGWVTWYGQLALAPG